MSDRRKPSSVRLQPTTYEENARANERVLHYAILKQSKSGKWYTWKLWFRDGVTGTALNQLFADGNVCGFEDILKSGDKLYRVQLLG